MKKYIISLSIATIATNSYSQSAIDAYNFSQPDMKGTARFMSMGGAFGALGGDLSSISQNPAGIGVYRNNDFGFTLNLDAQTSSSTADGSSYKMDQTKFLLNNIGVVLTLKLPNTNFPNFNFGFTYNKGASFNRVYGGNIKTLHNSMSNYIAGLANSENLSEGDVASSQGYNPYDYSVPWLPVLGYDSYLITPDVNPNTGATNWYGLWSDYMTNASTSGSGTFLMRETGGIDEFNIVFGGSIANTLYWGMNFQIASLHYTLNSIWGESLTNALVPDANNQLTVANADWNLNNYYSVSGSGFSYQLGLIYKPVQELRLGFAFHTPTWYNLNESFSASVDYLYGGTESGIATTNNGYLGYNDYGFRTPWKIIASAAGVLSSNFILSFDYEWANYGKMHFSEPTYYDGGYDYWEPWALSAGTKASQPFYDLSDPYGYENGDIRAYYKSTNTFRVGAEFKPIPSLSIRAGYAYVSSPVRNEAKNNDLTIYTAGTMPSYRFDNNTNYLSAGIGYRYNRFYVDLAYVYKNMKSEYHAYTPDPEPYDGRYIPSPQAKVSFSNSQVVLSAGYRF